ncbi:MAG: HNH endonuclease [Alphaproteobacteria bacterium]
MSEARAPTNDLVVFLTERMSMTDVYQPVIIKELLLHDGRRSKAELARVLAQYDVAIQEYYEKVVMRWPRKTLAKHEIVDYDRATREFQLRDFPDNDEVRATAVQVCERKIAAWLEKKAQQDRLSQIGSSIRYEVLKAARGKCQLCGVPALLRPIDIDHIVPRSQANKHGKVRKDGVWIDADSLENLQALCMSCNRAKRATDQTDFRPGAKLVRDLIPDIIRAEGRDPSLRRVSGAQLTHALFEKLVEEHAELIADRDDPARRLGELVDMVEVIIALASQQGVSEEQLLTLVHQKRRESGAFQEGFVLEGASVRLR